MSSSPEKDESIREDLRRLAIYRGDPDAERYSAASVWGGSTPDKIDADRRARLILNAIHGREVILVD